MVLVFPECPIFLYSFYCIIHDIIQGHLIGHLTSHIYHMAQMEGARSLLEAFRSNPVPARSVASKTGTFSESNFSENPYYVF